MTSADWDAFFNDNAATPIQLDLEHVHEEEINNMLGARVTDQEIDDLVSKLDVIAAEETDRRRRIARTLKAIAKMGDVGLRVFKTLA